MQSQKLLTFCSILRKQLIDDKNISLYIKCKVSRQGHEAEPPHKSALCLSSAPIPNILHRLLFLLSPVAFPSRYSLSPSFLGILMPPFLIFSITFYSHDSILYSILASFYHYVFKCVYRIIHHLSFAYLKWLVFQYVLLNKVYQWL